MFRHPVVSRMEILDAEADLFELLSQLIRRAASRAACTAGSSEPTMTPMIAITSNSTRVKPGLRLELSILKRPC